MVLYIENYVNFQQHSYMEKCKRQWCPNFVDPRFIGHVYCGRYCRDSDAKERLSKDDQHTWVTASLISKHPSPEAESAFSQLSKGDQALCLIQKYAPPDATGFRLGCPRSETAKPFTLRWFPIRGDIFALPPDPGCNLQLPTEGLYLVAYFARHGEPISAEHKINLPLKPANISWMMGDRILAPRMVRRF